MKKKKIITVIAMITIVATIGGTYAYSTAYAKGDNEIKVLDYKSPEVINERGYEISKCETTNVKHWLNGNKLITLKDKGVYRNPGQDKDIPIGYISIYDLETKTYKDYENTNVFKELNYLREGTSSPSDKYILFADPEEIPVEGNEEFNKSVSTGCDCHIKMDILDLTTGEVIEDFDKNVYNHGAYYKWIDDDYIFVLTLNRWRIINKSGKTIKEGKIDCSNSTNNSAFLLDMSGLKVLDNDVGGSFYYEKRMEKEENGRVEEVYSMDINTKEEKMIGRYDNVNFIQEKGDLLFLDYEKKDGNGSDSSTRCLKIVDNNGNEIQTYEFKGKSMGSVEVSPNGERCAIIDNDGDKNEKASGLDLYLKVMDVKSGEIKEVAPIKSLIDGTNNIESVDDIKNVAYRAIWNSTGTSLAFNSVYLSEKEGDANRSTYIIKFDK